MKYSVISSDNNIDYYSLLPLTCYSWNKIGYTPIVLHVGELPQYIKARCDNTLFQQISSAVGIKDSTLAQLSRIFVFEFVELNEEDIVITGDADMLVMKDIFTDTEEVVCYGYDLTGRSEIPICYIKMPVRKWRQIMGPLHFPQNTYSDTWEIYWGVDQQFATQKLKEYGFDKIKFVDRGFAGPIAANRWDRYSWNIKPADIIDVHMLRSPLANWDKITDMCVQLWPQDNWKWLDDYKGELDGKGKVVPSLLVSVLPDLYNKMIALQQELDHFADTDEHSFLQNVTTWDNHRVLLLHALRLTKGNVIEYGSGDGSSPYLKKYCEANNRQFKSYDSDLFWCTKTGAEFISDWDKADIWNECSVALLDHAPGEHRHIALQKLQDKAEIIVCHDSELNGAGNYMYEKVFKTFKYVLHYNRTAGGAGATALSNTIDLNQFRGLHLGEFQFEK